GLAPSTLYNFRVKAVNSLGASNGANLTVMTLPPPPTVVSIIRASFDPTAAGKSVVWTVTFSGSVTGVDAGDFVLTQ
ncbi:MAG: hypothetical protein JZU63_07065, partial [Rhodoferax sp.]|nr:hypothetical protein [Rhodoferax sp.]